MDQGYLIPLRKMLGWGGEKLSHDEHDLVLMYEDYLGEIDEIVTIWEGPENPIGIDKDIRAYANEHGRIEEIDKYNKKYIPNDENEIVLVVLDTMNLIKTTKDFPTKKSAIDEMSDRLRHHRDFFGYTPVVVSQFNRDISNPIRIKSGSVEPMLEDFKESGQTQDDFLWFCLA